MIDYDDDVASSSHGVSPVVLFSKSLQDQLQISSKLMRFSACKICKEKQGITSVADDKRLLDVCSHCQYASNLGISDFSGESDDDDEDIPRSQSPKVPGKRYLLDDTRFSKRSRSNT